GERTPPRPRTGRLPARAPERARARPRAWPDRGGERVHHTERHRGAREDPPGDQVLGAPARDYGGHVPARQPHGDPVVAPDGNGAELHGVVPTASGALGLPWLGERDRLRQLRVTRLGDARDV